MSYKGTAEIPYILSNASLVAISFYELERGSIFR